MRRKVRARKIDQTDGPEWGAFAGLLLAIGVLVVGTWGLCTPFHETRCIVNANGIHLGWSPAVGPATYVDIYPAHSIVMWGMIEWHEIELIRIRRTVFGTAYLSVRYASRGAIRTLNLSPVGRECEAALRERLSKEPKYVAS